MTSHRTRMQYEHQRQTSGFGRIDSQSSLRSDDPLRTPSVSSFRGANARPADPTSSVISGSTRPRVHTGSAADAVSKVYENLPDGARPFGVARPPSSTGLAGEPGERSQRAGSVVSYPASTIMGKSVMYSTSQLKLSRSLKASKASIATYKSGRTTIQAEHHDRKVQRELNSVKFGRGRKLYWISVASFIMFLLVLFVGLLITCLRFIYMNLILSLDVGEMVGPLLIATSFFFFGLGMKFYYDAYKIGCEERRRIKYKAASPSTVAVTTVNERVTDTEEKLVSGQTSQNALTRAPIGSRTTLLVP
ncbi:hypothetical protein PHET_01440 [Paragonimus heterotremus]|uniref:Uncharacterized protein n=1 Tax=Paragonimus heterotremus TaxID=100268 RepID=A0A8J4WJ89_9TREM|nr:hypothetical protein PHET_01440 [Paragonimus heterotremus]